MNYQQITEDKIAPRKIWNEPPREDAGVVPIGQVMRAAGPAQKSGTWNLVLAELGALGAAVSLLGAVYLLLWCGIRLAGAR